MTPEQTARHYYVAHDFAEAYEDGVRILAREARELEAYKAKPDHNQKAAAIREEKAARLLHFVHVTREALELQGQRLAELTAIERKYKIIYENHEKLKAWARSKGFELELLDFMHLNEFRLYGL